MLNTKCKILVVDKKGNYPYLFQGFRKNKFAISTTETIATFTAEQLINYDLFFVVLYENKDLFQLLKFNNTSSSVIVASEKIKIIKNFKKFKYFPFVNLLIKGNVITSLHDCVRQFFG